MNRLITRIPTFFIHANRSFASNMRPKNNRDVTMFNYILSVGIAMIGVGYAAVPLYRIYCTKTGAGSNPDFARAKTETIRSMQPVKDRKLVIHFSADTHSKMTWNFHPVQNELTIVPGETALAFYSAKNPTDKPVIGIATYSIMPIEAAKYFNKIQCFCFEEQRLNPYEEVDMPVFFFIDPEFDSDPKLVRTKQIILHYTFFEAKEDSLNVPGISTPRPQAAANSQVVTA